MAFWMSRFTPERAWTGPSLVWKVRLSYVAEITGGGLGHVRPCNGLTVAQQKLTVWSSFGRGRGVVALALQVAA